MAHDSNGRIYIGSTGVEIADLQAVFNLPNNNYLGSLITQAASLGRIKPWAKFKATRANGQNPTDAWKGEMKSIYGSATGGYTCGFSLNEYSSLSTLKSAMDANNFGWVYEPPRGASYGTGGEYFRIKDFNEYLHTATSPFHRFGLENEQFPTIDTYPAYLYVDFARSTNELAAGDFELFDDWYFGIAVYGGGSGQLVGKGTATDAFGQQSDASRRVTMILPTRAQGSCYVYPFFSYNQIAWSDSASEPSGTQRYIPLPFGRETITVVSGGLLGGLTFAFGTGGSVTYVSTNDRLTIAFPSFSATNNNGSQKQLGKSYIYYQAYIQKISDPSSHWESPMTTMGLSGSLTIAANSTSSVFSSQSKVLSNPSGTGTIAGETSTMNLLNFISNAGGTFADDYTTSVLMYYYDSDHNTYLLMEANPPFVYPA